MIYSLDLGKIGVWEELIEVFIKHFAYNAMINVTLRDLETSKQRNNETFSKQLVP
jgi:hypothetical protein